MIKYTEDGEVQARNYQKLTKPLIEKRRRARINLCLMQLKDMVIDSGRHNIENPKCKYEKADILELTVDYLQNLHKTQELAKSKSEQSFVAGFIECAKQVEHFMKYLTLSDNDSRQESDPISHKLLSHLENYFQLELSQKQNSVNSDIIIDKTNDDNIENTVNINNTNNSWNSMSPNSFSVIHHTSQYSVGSPSSSRTLSPIPPLEMTQSSVPSSPFLTELDKRPVNQGLYGNERNGHCYQVMDLDGVWRPW